MEQIRAWVLAVCFACIAAGILGQLSSSRTRFSVIKLILTLYILITAFAPLQSLGDGHVTFDIPEAPQTVQAPDTEAMVLNTVCTRLEDTVRSACGERDCIHRSGRGVGRRQRDRRGGGRHCNSPWRHRCFGRGGCCHKSAGNTCPGNGK